MRTRAASLKRLKTDHIDLYQFHHVDRATPWEEIWQAMEVAVGQGKVLYVGSSNFAGWHIAQAQAAAAQRHFMGLVSEQSLYNLLARTVELEVLPSAPQEQLQKHRERIERYEDFAAELGHEPGDVALAWLLHQPAVTAPIVGPRTAAQLESAVRALDVKALARLDEIFPGHKPAPEDYAW